MRRTGTLARLGAGVVVLALAVSVGAPAQAATAKPAAGHGSVQAFRDWIVGKKSSGPNDYTNNYYAKITGSHMIYDAHGCATGVYQPDDEGIYVNPAVARPTPRTNAAQAPAVRPNTVRKPLCTTSIRQPQGVMQPDSWWNPGSWNWGKVIGDTWDKIWNGCIKGAAEGVVGTASGTLIINLLARGGKIFIGPEGYAALAIGGCVVGLVFG